MTEPALPLDGLRILTLAHLYPGPFATMILADLGADVIIVEGPATPDRTRRFSGHFEALNRNKRAVAIDLKSEQGRLAFLRLAETADAVLEGFRPGVMSRLGLGPETLQTRNPRLVVVSISGYGQTGPMASHGAHDISLQGTAGMLNIPLGEEAAHPLPPLVLADIAAANAAAIGVVVALLQRERSAHAARVDVSMLDSLVAWMAPHLVPAINGQDAARLPPTDPGYGVFLSADGKQLTLSISGEDHLWRSLCDLLALPHLAELSELQRIADRVAIQTQLRQAVIFHPMEWLERNFAAAYIPFGRVNRLTEVASDPQVKARELFIERSTASGSTYKYIRQPLVFDGFVSRIHRSAPALGEHNDELLG